MIDQSLIAIKVIKVKLTPIRNNLSCNIVLIQLPFDPIMVRLKHGKV